MLARMIRWLHPLLEDLVGLGLWVLRGIAIIGIAIMLAELVRIFFTGLGSLFLTGLGMGGRLTLWGAFVAGYAVYTLGKTLDDIRRRVGNIQDVVRGLEKELNYTRRQVANIQEELSRR